MTTERADLIEGLRRGERDAFRQVFERYKDTVYSIALRYSGDPAAAEDIAQDTFAKLFTRIDSFRGDAGFDSWLYRVVVNACFDYRRMHRRWLPLLDKRAAPPAALTGLLRSEAEHGLVAAVAALPSEQRMTVVLRYSQDMAYDQIAAAMNCSAGTVASRLNRALKTLEKKVRKADAQLD